MVNNKDMLPSGGSTDTSIGLKVDPTAVAPTDCSLDENEKKTNKNLTDEMNSATVVAVVASDTPGKLRQQIKRLWTLLSSCKLAYTKALSRQEDVWLKQKCQFQKYYANNKKKITKLKSELCGLKEEG